MVVDAVGVSQIGSVVRGVVCLQPHDCAAGQIQASKPWIWTFQKPDGSDRLFVMLEPTDIFQEFFKDGFAAVTEGAMSEVMGEADDFGESRDSVKT